MSISPIILINHSIIIEKSDTLQNDWTFWFAWATRILILLFYMFQKSKKCSQSAKACQKQLLLG